MTMHILASSILVALKFVTHAMSTDKKHKNLCRVLVQNTQCGLIMVATDGQRLARATVPHTDQPLSTWTASIEASDVARIKKALAPYAKKCAMVSVSADAIETQDGAFKLPLSGESGFPVKYEQCIPTIGTAWIEYVDTEELATVSSALSAANNDARGSLFTEYGKLQFMATTPGGVTIRATVYLGDHSGRITETRFCFNYLHDAARAFQGSPARLQWSGELEPLAMTSSVQSVELMVVVMPMRI